MKPALTFLILIGALAPATASTSINPTNKFAYGANIGWIDARGNTNSGAVIGEFVCSGYLYSANAGWIHLGSNAPANGIQYQNNSATDYGVNNDGLGNLRGFAYSANAGWINFESKGAPKVNLQTGKLSGSIYSANCGWIDLSNAFAVVPSPMRGSARFSALSASIQTRMRMATECQMKRSTWPEQIQPIPLSTSA